MAYRINRIASYLRTGKIQSLAFELVVIALGIFLGLQADQWYEDRQDDERLENYLNRLLVNVNSDIDALNIGIELTRSRLSMVDDLYRSIDDASVVSNDPASYLIALQQATFKFGSGSSAANSTYNELTSTGDMRLVPTSVRERIYEYF